MSRNKFFTLLVMSFRDGQSGPGLEELIKTWNVNAKANAQ
jgi:hypothetical protein